MLAMGVLLAAMGAGPADNGGPEELYRPRKLTDYWLQAKPSL